MISIFSRIELAKAVDGSFFEVSEFELGFTATQVQCHFIYMKLVRGEIKGDGNCRQKLMEDKMLFF